MKRTEIITSNFPDQMHIDRITFEDMQLTFLIREKDLVMNINKITDRVPTVEGMSIEKHQMLPFLRNLCEIYCRTLSEKPIQITLIIEDQK